MSDLIRRQDVIEEIKQFSTDNIRLRNGLMELANHMELIPSVDAVEVVRCKDCCYWDRETVRQNSNDVSWWNEAVCRQHSVDGNEPHEMWTDADWFCKDDERRIE